MSKSKHDQERDRIAADWLTHPSFICDGCGVECNFPGNLSISTEIRYAGGLRADVGATGTDGRLIGVVEVIDTSGPTPRAFAEQSKMGFAYYRHLTPPPIPKSLNGGHYENHMGRFDYLGVDLVKEAVWLCSGDCLVFYEQLKGAKRTNNWDAPRCDVCGEYLHDNPLSRVGFTDWAYDPYTAFCIHCAARCDASAMQWRSPGELAGGDPREWTPDNDAAPADLFLAYCMAAFWSMVWSGRTANLGEPDTYDGSRNEDADNATAKRLPLVNAALNAGEWRNAMNLLLPIGAPGWAAYEDEPERMLAWGSDNCRGTASAWEKLLPQIRGALPCELASIIKEGEESRQRGAPGEVSNPHKEVQQEAVPTFAPRPNRLETDRDDDLSQAWEELNRRFGYQHGQAEGVQCSQPHGR
jgi:hypothetical protein